MRVRKTRIQILEGRIREMRRNMLHQRDKGCRDIWKSHIEFLQGEIEHLKAN